MENKNAVSIFASGEAELRGKAVFNFEAPIEELQHNLILLLKSVDGVVQDINSGLIHSNISEVQVNIGIDGRGKVGLLGIGTEVSAGASMSVKIAVRNQHKLNSGHK